MHERGLRSKLVARIILTLPYSLIALLLGVIFMLMR